VHEMQTGHRRKTQVLEHKGLWRRCACFYRQVLIFQNEGMWRLLQAMWHKSATAFWSTFLTFPKPKLEELNGKTKN
jgi:hypothetical protein